MRKEDVAKFFDARAAHWDREMIKSDRKINTILDNARVHPDSHVLDVACGTGVLIPYYLERRAASVTAIDISSEMIKIAEGKFPQAHVRFICGDAEEVSFDRPFDCIVIYNAFPHFPDPARLIGRLSSLLAEGGTLTVAHGMSRADIDGCHGGSAAHVSRGLMHEDALEELFSRYLTVTAKISDEEMYQVCGRR